MKYKVQTNIVVDERKLNILLRLGCPDHIIFAKICGKKVRSSGDKLIDETLECLVSRKRYNNWGGNHNPQGKNQYSKRGQVDHQVDHQVDQPKTGQLGTLTLTSTNTITSVNTNSRNTGSLVSTARAKKETEYPSEYQDIKNYLATQISQKLGRTVPTHGWLDDIRKLCEIDHAEPKRVLDALHWHFENYDREYRLEIQSAKTLREKFTRLDMAFQKATEKDNEPFYL